METSGICIYNMRLKKLTLVVFNKKISIIIYVPDRKMVSA